MCRRIALMTWHNTENYGTAYQAYALRRLIEIAGCDVELVDYKRLGVAPLAQLSVSKLISGYICAVFSSIKFQGGRYQFNSNTFRHFWKDNLNYTKECRTNQDFRVLNQIFDGFVCGSDQIWGPEWFDARFFLDFVEDKRRLISYAPSIGVPEITNDGVADEMARLMGRFPYLSVREETGCRIAAQLTGRNDVVNVLDPVLALPTDEWEKLQEYVPDLPQRYSLIFFLKNSEKNIKISVHAAEKKGCKPVVLHCTQSEDTSYANTGDLTPGQLLTYIRNAEYICTDSFHITVLSIIFGKNFKVFKKDSPNSKTSKNNRISDLLKRFGISNAEYDENTSFDNKIYYEKVHSTLKELRQKSNAYIKNAIDNLPKEQPSVLTIKKCEVNAREHGVCKGEQTAAFLMYGKKLKGLAPLFYHKMELYPFSMEEKCYRCKFFNTYAKPKDNRKPLFWNELQEDLKKNKSIWHLFKKYYLAYCILDMVSRRN